VNDRDKAWRLVYRIDPDAIVILEVFEKKTNQMPRHVIEACQRRLMLYQASRL
jgi:phage-related protein